MHQRYNNYVKITEVHLLPSCLNGLIFLYKYFLYTTGAAHTIVGVHMCAVYNVAQCICQQYEIIWWLDILGK